MKAREFSRILGVTTFVCAFALIAGNASAYDPGDISPLGGGGNDYCVSEDGSDGNGNANGCIDGVGLSNSVSALQVSPDGKRLFVLGFDGFLAPIGDSITTYDRSSGRSSLSVDPRINACRSAGAVPDCSQGGSQAVLLTAPTGLAISPDSKQVYVSARRSNSITVFDYVAIPEDPSEQQGPLVRKAAPNGCVTEEAQDGCLNGRALSRAFDVVMSPDGNTVYTAGNLATGGGIGVFDRASDGVLTQKSGMDGCVNETGDFGCADGSHLEPLALAISADGKNLYAASNEPTSSITIFDIDPDGTIEQKSGPAGCSTRDGSGGDCTPNPYLHVPVDIAITPDGESVYVATDLEDFEDAPDVAPLVNYYRNPETGTLTSMHCFAAEAAFGCAETAGLYRPITVEATDEAVYVGSQLRNADQISGEGAAPGGLVILNRTGSDIGELSQKPVEGCWTPTEFDDCVTLSTINVPRAIDVSPDGDSLYVGGDRITVFNRNDGTEPDSVIGSGPTGETLSTDASFTFSGDKPNVFFECSLDTTDIWQECSSPQSYSGLSPGQHTFRVRATDVFEQVETTPAEHTWTVINESVPPETTIDSGPQGEINATSASFTFSSNESGTFECRMDAQPFAACTSPKEFTGLVPGAHTFQVRAIDDAENVDPSPAERSFTVIEEVIQDTRVDAIVTAAKLQKQKGKTIVVAVRIRANEALTAKLSGSVKKGKRKATFKPVTRRLKAGSTNTIKLRPVKNGPSRLVAAALLGSKRAVPKILITLTDGAMNRRVVKPKIKIQGAPKRR